METLWRVHRAGHKCRLTSSGAYISELQYLSGFDHTDSMTKHLKPPYGDVCMIILYFKQLYGVHLKCNIYIFHMLEIQLSRRITVRFNIFDLIHPLSQEDKVHDIKIGQKWSLRFLS
jgi:hypothetical protein